LRKRSPPEVEVDHRIGPVLVLQSCGINAEFWCTVLLEMPARKVAPEHRVGVIGEVVSVQQVGGGRSEVAHIKIEVAPEPVCKVFRIEPGSLVIVGDGAVEVTLVVPDIAAGTLSV